MDATSPGLIHHDEGRQLVTGAASPALPGPTTPAATVQAQGTWKSELKAIMGLAVPTIVQTTAQQAMIVTDNIFVGHLGTNELAAAALGNMYNSFLTFFLLGTATALDTLGATAHGAARSKVPGATSLASWTATSALVVTALCIPALVCLSVAQYFASGVLRQDEEISHMVGKFCHGLMPGVVPMIWSTVLMKYLQVQGVVLAPAVVTALTFALNIGANFAFIDAAGFQGAPFATSFSQWVQFLGLSTLVTIFVLTRTARAERWRRRQQRRQQLKSNRMAAAQHQPGPAGAPQEQEQQEQQQQQQQEHATATLQQQEPASTQLQQQEQLIGMQQQQQQHLDVLAAAHCSEGILDNDELFKCSQLHVLVDSTAVGVTDAEALPVCNASQLHEQQGTQVACCPHRSGVPSHWPQQSQASCQVDVADSRPQAQRPLDVIHNPPQVQRHMGPPDSTAGVKPLQRLRHWCSELGWRVLDVIFRGAEDTGLSSPASPSTTGTDSNSDSDITGSLPVVTILNPHIPPGATANDSVATTIGTCTSDGGPDSHQLQVPGTRSLRVSRIPCASMQPAGQHVFQQQGRQQADSYHLVLEDALLQQHSGQQAGTNGHASRTECFTRPCTTARATGTCNEHAGSNETATQPCATATGAEVQARLQHVYDMRADMQTSPRRAVSALDENTHIADMYVGSTAVCTLMQPPAAATAQVNSSPILAMSHNEPSIGGMYVVKTHSSSSMPHVNDGSSMGAADGTASRMELLQVPNRDHNMQHQQGQHGAVKQLVEDVWMAFKSGASRQHVWTYLKLGIPGGVMLCFEFASFEVHTSLAAQLGPTITAAHSALLNIITLTYVSVPFAVGIAASIRVGNLLGAGLQHTAQRASRMCLAVGISFMLCCAIAMLSARHRIGAVFSSDPDVIAVVATIVPMAALFQVSDGVLGPSQGVLRGCGKQTRLMVFTLVGFWGCGVLLGALLCFKAGLGVQGLWWGIASGDISTATMTVISMLRLNWPHEAAVAQKRLQMGATVSEDIAAAGRSDVEATAVESGRVTTAVGTDNVIAAVGSDRVTTAVGG